MQIDYAVDIFECLDRFSLDSVGFTCTALKGIVDEHLPEADAQKLTPLRVFESLTIEHVQVVGQWRREVLACTLVPDSPLGKALTIDDTDDAVNEDEDESENARRVNVLRKTAALCANRFVKFFKINEYSDSETFLHAFREQLPAIRIQRLMIVEYVREDLPAWVVRAERVRVEQHIIQDARGVESLLMKTERADVGAESMLWLKEHGVRRLAVYDARRLVIKDGVRAFCIDGPRTEDKAAPGRSLYLHEANLSFKFLQQLAQECLGADAGRVPTVIFHHYGDFVPPLPEHLAQARHGKDDRRCLHFRFDAIAGPYEIVVQSRGCNRWKVTLRGGHSAVPHCAKMCRRENWYRELEEINV